MKPRTRIQKYLIDTYGIKALNDIKLGNTQLYLNDKLIEVNDKFRDHRVSEASVIELKPVITFTRCGQMRTRHTFNEESTLPDPELRLSPEMIDLYRKRIFKY